MSDDEEDFVFVDTLSSQHKGHWLYANGTSDVVVPCNAYDLGMPTLQNVSHQLSLDLPRSRVMRKSSPHHLPPLPFPSPPLHSSDSAPKALLNYVLKHTVNPRMCTQAALAPPLEWIMLHGYLAHELPSPHPTSIQLGLDGTIEVTKRLGLRTWTTDMETDSTSKLLDIHIKAFPKAVVVGLTSSDATDSHSDRTEFL